MRKIARWRGMLTGREEIVCTGNHKQAWDGIAFCLRCRLPKKYPGGISVAPWMHSGFANFFIASSSPTAADAPGNSPSTA
jgi:hypothetical protein